MMMRKQNDWTRRYPWHRRQADRQVYSRPCCPGCGTAGVAQAATSGELAAMTAQTEINKAEASNPSVFVSGWRPAIGWVCALAMGYQYLARPLMVAFMPALAFPGLDDNLWQLMMGMLGLGGLRTFEKTQGVASK